MDLVQNLIFYKKKINLEKELKTLNDFLLKHEGNNYEEFSVCLEHLLLPDRAFGFISRKKVISKNVFQFFGKPLEYCWWKWQHDMDFCRSKIFLCCIILTKKILAWKKCSLYWIVWLKPMDLVLGGGSFHLWCRSPILNIRIMII